jgi:hydroxyacylglutathione hydrolase
MFTVLPVRAFEDNYIWLLHNGHHAALVDPGDATPALAALEQHGLQLSAILITHRHGDHIGGITELLQHFPVPVFGPTHEPIPGLTHPVTEGDIIELPDLAVPFTVLDVPGHTIGHVAYYGGNSLFCGDTLFACGCGRIFEGSPPQMYASLQKISRLPNDTSAYCAHEYTLENIRFAKLVEPGNQALLEREKRDKISVAAGRPSVPSTIALENLTNPFLRCSAPEVVQSASRYAGKPLSNPVDVFAVLRKWKDEI